MPTKPTILHLFLRTRRTIRKFKADPVPDEIVERILTTATYAPSAHDLQPWRFVIIKTPSTRKRLGEALTNAMREDMILEGAKEFDIEKRAIRSLRRTQEAPVVILLCRDLTAIRDTKPEDTIMSIQSVSNAGLQLLLATHAEGLGGNWICWPLFAQEETRETLNLPPSWEPQAMFFLGYPAHTFPTKVINTSEVVIKR